MRALILTAVVTTALWTSSAAAQNDDDQRARLHFQAGQSYYDSGEYEDALREFTRAQELSHKPELFYNISLCYQSLGNYTQAAEYLQRYLTEAPDIPNRGSLEARLENFHRRAAEHGSGTPDTTQQGTPPGDTTQQGTSPSNDAPAAEATTTPSPSDEGSSGGGPGVGPYVVMGVGGAGLLTATIFGILALSEESSVSDGCGATTSCSEDDVSSMDTLALVSDLGLVVGVVGVGAGLTWLLVGGSNDGERETAAVRVTPWASPDGAGASAMGRF